MNENIVIQKDYYRLILNLPHRRLIVDDTFRLFQSLPQKKVYPSTGCFYERCLFPTTCNKCVYSYDVLDL